MPKLAIESGSLRSCFLLATILSIVIGVAIGVYTASRQYKAGDRIWQGISIIAMNTHIVVASIVVVGFGLKINEWTGQRVFYVIGARSIHVEGFFPTLIDILQHLTLPTIAMVFISYAGYHMTQRTLLLDNLNADYVRTARAKGLPRGWRFADTRCAPRSSRLLPRWRFLFRGFLPALL